MKITSMCEEELTNSHPETDMDHGHTDIHSLNCLPDDIIFNIMQYHSSTTLRGVASLCRTVGQVSKFFRERVKKFVQVSPIHCKLHWHSSHKFVLEQRATANPNQKIPKPYRTFAWLCKNHVKIGTLDASSFQEWNYLDACLLSYILEQCDLSELIEVRLTFVFR
jgi:hypothetical protein